MKWPLCLCSEMQVANTCMHACIHTYIHTYMHTYIYAYMSTFVCIHCSAYAYVCICIHIHMYIHMCTCKYVHIYIYTHAYLIYNTCVCTCIYTYIYTYIYIYRSPLEATQLRPAGARVSQVCLEDFELAVSCRRLPCNHAARLQESCGNPRPRGSKYP